MLECPILASAQTRLHAKPPKCGAFKGNERGFQEISPPKPRVPSAPYLLVLEMSGYDSHLP